MATTQEVFQTIMRQNQQMAEQNARLMQIMERIGIQEGSSSPKSSSPEFIIESLASNIREFIYDPENGLVLNRWYRKYEDLFLRDGAKLDDAVKVRFFLRSLSVNVHEKHVNFVFPKHPREFFFEETVTKLTELFSTRISLLSKRYKCFQLRKNDADDLVSYAAWDNADIRTRLLSKLEATGPEDERSLEILIKDAQRLQNLKLDTVIVEQHQQRYKAKFPEVFKSTLGHCTKTKVRLYLKANAQPVFKPKRPVPFTFVEKIDLELERLQKLNIITPVEFSQWAASIVAVKKPGGRIQICADYSTALNAALEPNNYPLPVPDDIFSKLNGCKFFSIIDLNDAYLQVEVDDDSKQLLTINTHRGLFRFNRLAPGVKSAPGACQQLMNTMITGLKGVDSFLNDILLYSLTEEEHRRILDRLFMRLQNDGFDLREEKCNLMQRQIRYLGHIVYVSGLRPDPSKVEAIVNMPAQTDFGYADVLSRLIDKHLNPDEEFVIASVQLEEDVEIPLQEAISSVPITFKMVTNATLKCPVLQQVSKFIENGWPSNISEIVNPAVKPFFPHRDALAIIKNCIMMSNRLVIPEFYQQRILKQLHRGHPGMERMKVLARSHFWWPKIDDDISTFVRKSEMCAVHAKSPPKTPPQPWPATHFPWERIHIKFAGPFKGLNFLVVVDAHSR
ncbi:uncharacterized protein K02A2.6-like [Uranotaenia lowii]|uniref:uncharacterized protein K02A2.6-like n=1 Tax=Uranotaenia lowii TaxID=190385 RepID=UPI002479B0DB|nr:uncharacterized protein K02A2.6-like [Uranotaenia lowii]